MKGTTQNMALELAGKTFYDCRMEDYFIVVGIEGDENFVNIQYAKKTHRNKKEAVSFITYHIDNSQYLPKIV